MRYNKTTKAELIEEIKKLKRELSRAVHSKAGEKGFRKESLESDKKYHHLFNIGSDPHILIANKDGQILDANLAASKLYGYTLKELVRLKNTDLSAEPKDTRRATLNRLLSVPIRFHKTKDGMIFPVEITASHFIWNGTPVHLASIRDISDKYNSRLKIEEQNAFLQKVIDSSPNFIYVKDLQGRIMLANQSISHFIGKRIKSIVGKKEISPASNVYLGRAANKEDSSLLQGKMDRIQKEEAFKDSRGITRWFYTFKTPIKNSEGCIQNLISISIDISERKKIENAAVERETNYKSLIEASLDAIYVLQRKRLILVNPAWEKLFGYSSEEATSKEYNVMKIVAPESKKMIKDKFSRMKNSHPMSSRYEMKALSKDGRKLDLEVSVSRIKWNGSSAFQGIYRDISERKRTEEALRREAFIFNNLYDAVIITDSQGQILNWNTSATKMYGYDKEEVIDKYFDILTREDGIRVMNEILSAVAQKGRWSGETRFIRKDGTRGIAETIVFPFRDRNGEEIALVGVNRDITERKTAEAALRESENKFRKIAENYLVGIYLIQDNIFKYVNHRLAEMFEYTDDELIDKKGPDDLVYKDSIEFVQNNIRKRLEGELDSIHYEFRGVTKSNKIIEVEVFGSRSIYMGRPAIVGTVLEITERKRVEQIIKDSEYKYRTLVESANDAILIADASSGKIIEANKKAEKLLGRKRDEIIGMHQKDIHPETPDGFYLDKFKEAAENIGGYLNKDVYVKHKNGKLTPVEVSNSVFTMGNSKLVQGIFRDISERIEAEGMIRKLSRAVEQSPNSIVITGLKGNIEYINPRFTDLTGYTWNEAIGKNPRILKSGYTEKEEYENLWESISSGNTWRGEFHNKKKNGELYWESASISPIINHRGEITHYLAIKEDITEKKIIEEELRVAKDKAEESDRLKSEFLAQMSHEIRSPLNVILSFNSFLKTELEQNVSEELVDSFASIDSAGKRLLRTIDMILNMAALQSGYIDIKPQRVNLPAIIEGLIKEFEQHVVNKSLNISFRKESEENIINTDDYIVTEIFQNLIGNAVKYTEKGKVDIRIYENKSKNICVDISDTGIGISKKYLPKLFLPFSQEESGYSRSFEGNGLGLALVKNYISLINAEIKVKSEKGRGSTFTVIFKN